MSLRSGVGSLVLWGAFLYLIVQGCIALRPARTVAVVSTLFVHRLGSCGCLTGDPPINRASFSEGAQDDVAPTSSPHHSPRTECELVAGIRQPSVPR